MSELIDVLMERDGLSRDDVDQMLEDCRYLIFEDGMDPEEALQGVCGLEPDYVVDLLQWIEEKECEI